MNNNCPKCGADYNGRPEANQHDYWCGSTTWGEGDFYQSPECVRRERDKLLERMRRLEQVGHAMHDYCDAIDELNKERAKKAKR